MSLLLDTHALVWAIAEPTSLSSRARASIEDAGQTIVVSAVSAFEIATKARLGKLPGGEVITRGLDGHLARLRVDELALTVEHGRLAGDLEWDHRDPFDRLLAAQAIVEGLTLVTKDRAFSGLHGLRTIW